MCGICGDVDFGAAPDESAVRRMARSLAHRGPDAEGFFLDGPAALGHRRLSILDLSGGVQPMVREGVALSFNGQAYEHEEVRERLRAKGHSFTTRSDTEVVLRAYLEWGERFVDELHGMFAIALWDAPRRKLVLARDRLGKKPLYYALAHGSTWTAAPDGAATRVVFGSELKAFAAHGAVPRELDPEALAQYLAVEYVPAPHSIHRHIFKLPAAHVAVLDERGFRLRRYWELPAPTRERIGAHEAGEELVRLLDGAVARRLVADVPVGVFLSGGIDSTTISALATRHKDPLQTFSIGFTEESFDETPYALLASRRLGTQHSTEKLSGQACLDLLPEAVASLDEPFADPSFLPTLLLSRFTRRSVKVALAGDGGDELFAGYDPFLAHRPAAFFGRLPRGVHRLLRGAADRLPASSRNMSLDFRVKQFLRGASAPASLRHQAWIGAFLPEELSELLHPDLRRNASPDVAYREVLAEAERGARAGVHAGSVDEALRFYLGRYLADDILVKADRASMAASLELRAPFLDTHVVEFASRLPWKLKLSLTRTKVLLKRALRGIVPVEILERPKKGFGIPVAAWIRGPLRPMFEELFSEAELRRAGLFDPRTARAMLQRHFDGQADLRKPLWTLAMFQLWQRKWGGATASLQKVA
ncbi:MAG TPA: asparagine synthase (glutamine-hydrolyzing) [Myxococcales bacterium]|jgi:asparagine synthase (glutamine-hydrolysing)|nr:asparagine synthase (glutamine-hydrolyzing) [Myxococcales bacterium]